MKSSISLSAAWLHSSRQDDGFSVVPYGQRDRLLPERANPRVRRWRDADVTLGMKNSAFFVLPDKISRLAHAYRRPERRARRL